MRFEQAYDPLRCLNSAWSLLKRTPGTVFLGVLGPLGVQYALSSGVQLLMLPMLVALQDRSKGIQPGFAAVLIAIGSSLAIAQLVFMTWIDIGFARAIRAALATSQEQMKTIFGGGDRLGTLLLARLFIGLLVLLVYGLMVGALLVLGVLSTTSTMHGLAKAGALGFMAATFLALIYVFLGLQFVTPFVAFEQCSASEAIQRSWELAAGKRLRLVLFWIYLTLVLVAGLLVCLVGLLVALPLVETMRLEAFVAFRYPKLELPSEPEDWSSAAAPPPSHP